MRKIIFYLCLFSQLFANAQFVGTPYIVPIESRPVLDQIGITPSFAFSTRKLREGYTGPAVRIRRSVDNAEADVAFDTNNVVSDNSTVTIAVVGTSGLALNSTLTLSSFRSGNTLYVSTWYDQGANGYHANQSTVASQPVFTMASAGAANQYASLLFDGISKRHVIVNQSLSTLLTNALKGTLGIVAMPTPATSSSNSFGYFDLVDSSKRWSAHLNWPGGTCYLDFGLSTDSNRNFINLSNENKYKQYSFIRNTANKTAKVSGVFKLNNVVQNQQTATITGDSSFGIGLTTGKVTSENGYFGNFSEFILFNDVLNTAQLNVLENNQMVFWGAY